MQVQRNGTHTESLKVNSEMFQNTFATQLNAMERNGKHWNTPERKQTAKSQLGWITSERKGTQRGVPSSTLRFKQPGSSHSPLRKDPGSISQVAGELLYGFVSGLSCLPLREALLDSLADLRV